MLRSGPTAAPPDLSGRWSRYPHDPTRLVLANPRALSIGSIRSIGGAIGVVLIPPLRRGCVVSDQLSERLRQLQASLASLDHMLSETRDELAARNATDRHPPEVTSVVRLGVWWGDLAAGRLAGCETAADLWELSPGEHPVDHWLDRIAEEDRPAVAEVLTSQDSATARANRAFGLRFRLLTGDPSGPKTWIEARGQRGPSVLPGEGTGPRILAALWPLVSPPLAGDAGDEVPQLYQALSGTMRDYVQLANIHRQSLFVSPSFYAISGYTRDEVRNSDFSSRLHPDDLPRVERAWRANIAGRTTRVEWRLRHRDGTYRWMETIASPRRNRAGDVEAIASYTRDIDARKLAEIQLRQARKDAVDASRAKDAFVMQVSHELRTPLSVILGNVELALADENDAERREPLQSIRQSARGLICLVDDLLDLNRIQAGKLRLVLRPARLGDCLEQVRQYAELLARPKQIDVTAEWDHLLPEIARFDPDRLEQVLLNLVSNAVKFTPPGGSLRLRATADRTSQPRPRLVLEVEDSGYGIPEDKQEQIFQPFERHTPDGQPPVEGSGLGLSIAAEIVVLMGGQLSVVSAPGHGSTFAFAIPLETGEPVVAPLDD